jgi:hypothetical protein
MKEFYNNGKKFELSAFVDKADTTLLMMSGIVIDLLHEAISYKRDDYLQLVLSFVDDFLKNNGSENISGVLSLYRELISYLYQENQTEDINMWMNKILGSRIQSKIMSEVINYLQLKNITEIEQLKQLQKQFDSSLQEKKKSLKKYTDIIENERNRLCNKSTLLNFFSSSNFNCTKIGMLYNFKRFFEEKYLDYGMTPNAIYNAFFIKESNCQFNKKEK